MRSVLTVGLEFLARTVCDMPTAGGVYIAAAVGTLRTAFIHTHSNENHKQQKETISDSILTDIQ